MQPLKKTAFASLLAVISSQTNAAGFQLNEHSANGLGRAYAGEGAIAENAAVLARNPAAMTLFDKAQLSVAATYINPEVDITGHTTNHYGELYNGAAAGVNAAIPGADLAMVQTEFDAKQQDIAPDAVVPAIYYIRPIDEQWFFGFGVFSNFGLSTDYDSQSNTSEFADKAEVTTININPNLAYRINDEWSIGGGINLVYADAEIGSTTPEYMNGYVAPINDYNQIAEQIGAPTLLPVPGNATTLRMSGDDWAYGWNIGLLWQLPAGTRVALSYRSEVELELDGHAESDLSAALNDKGTLDLDLPAITELAIHQPISGQWSLQASAVYTQWGSFDKLEAKLDNLDEPVHIKDEYWDHAWRLAAGVTYLATPAWTLRAGYAYDETPVDAKHRTLSIPDTDRQWFTLGTSYQWDEAVSFDLGYAYLYGRKVDVSEEFGLTTTNPNTGAPIHIPVSSYQGQLNSADAHILSAQLNYQF
ncbi:long-chain fatty acid transporter [Corallincola luteus]|uniref:Long-chain fatty acid transporter n=1 Tax=Corallincola luteus TaxID=1775177 RepID=A0ABY2AJT3_9GAMM|nr:outer membrane protein transport protein [Corallincola luteus]TCI03032.1 long-chain fatty acid transporter [Corallincola luteus]